MNNEPKGEIPKSPSSDLSRYRIDDKYRTNPSNLQSHTCRFYTDSEDNSPSPEIPGRSQLVF